MAEFAEFYLDFLYELVRNIGAFFATIFSAFTKAFGNDIVSYIKKVGTAGKDFDVAGWITFILVAIINFTLIFFLIYRLAQLVRRYIIFRSKEVDKDELMEEMAKIRMQSDKIIQEKNQIFALKISERASSTNNVTEIAEQPQLALASRFNKLIAIDKEFAAHPHYVEMLAEDNLTLQGIVDRFVKYSASYLHLYYTHNVIRLFFAGMATTKVLILEGISGTGKTSLPYALSKFFKNNSTIVSVQPSWRDRQDLLGYLNEFTKKYNETDFLASIYEASYRDDVNLVILDEMNLARIEYYFAEFLSIMEMPDTTEWKIDLVPSAQEGDPKNIVEGKIIVPQNIWFVGTANQDDSTFTITDKVYDRAITIDLNNRSAYFDAPLTEPVNCSIDYLDQLYQKASNSNRLSETAINHIKIIDEFISTKFKITFGNRIMKQIKLFVPVFVGAGGDEVDALDFLVMSKILRKFSTLNLAFLSKELSELITLIDKTFGKNKFVLSIAYIKQLLAQV